MSKKERMSLLELLTKEHDEDDRELHAECEMESETIDEGIDDAESHTLDPISNSP